MINVVFDDQCSEEGENLKNIIHHSHLANVEQNIDVLLSENAMCFLNHETNPPSKIELKEIKNAKSNDLVYKLFPKRNSSILDCTGGFGRDAIGFSKLGYKVTMIEENPLIIMAVKKFLDKYDKANIRLMYGNSLDYLRMKSDYFDYIYIDSMFKKSKNKSKSKKDLELLQYLCREKITRFNLVKQATKNLCERIVIKDSLSSLLKYDSDYSIKTKLIRYNILKGNI